MMADMVPTPTPSRQEGSLRETREKHQNGNSGSKTQAEATHMSTAERRPKRSFCFVAPRRQCAARAGRALVHEVNSPETQDEARLQRAGEAQERAAVIEAQVRE